MREGHGMHGAGKLVESGALHQGGRGFAVRAAVPHRRRSASSSSPPSPRRACSLSVLLRVRRRRVARRSSSSSFVTARDLRSPSSAASLFEALLVASAVAPSVALRVTRRRTTLDHSLFSTARAVTNFDKDGNGLVKIEVDGQVVQLLARLLRVERFFDRRARAYRRRIARRRDRRSASALPRI